MTDSVAYTPEEIRAHRQQWVDALRSGEYQQGKGRLRRKTESGVDQFCCLGVACNESGLGDWQPVGSETFLYSITPFRAGEGTLLPEKVQEWLGFEYPSPRVDDRPLWELNDGISLAEPQPPRLSFTEIADLIERTWL